MVGSYQISLYGLIVVGVNKLVLCRFSEPNTEPIDTSIQNPSMKTYASSFFKLPLVWVSAINLGVYSCLHHDERPSTLDHHLKKCPFQNIDNFLYTFIPALVDFIW